MRYLRIGEPGLEIPVVCHDGRYYDLSGRCGDIDAAFLAGGGVSSVAGLPEIDVAGRRAAAPIAKPGAIVCVGMNYAAHAAEGGHEPPAEPVVFFKHPNTIVGPNDEVQVPRGAERTDWEVELGVVIGKRASYLESEAEALECVAGFVACNDLSERHFQIDRSGGQFSKGKCAPTFMPLGPALVTPDEIPDVQALRLWSKVNGEIRQDSSSADMIFSVAHLIFHLSQFMALDPGDLLSTGTPEGVALSGRYPYLAAGDVVEVGIDGLGSTKNPLVRA